MPNRFDRDWDERNRGEFGGYYARDTHPGFGDDYARDRGWSGAGGHEQYARDERRPSFRGRGPKNWRPTDERVREVVNELLTEHDGVDATDIEVTASAGEVTLEGVVGSRWEKRLAEDIAASVIGVRDVHNRLRLSDRE